MIAVDWGTTSLRAYRLDAKGRVVEQRDAPKGILSVAREEFPQVLEAICTGWKEMPVLMSGMVGSRQGWMEVAYVQCPAGVDNLAANAQQVREGMWIVPGVSFVDESGVPDVMRGEETQIIGAMDEIGGDGLVCLPGTHSKWVRVRDGRITGLRTYFTGETFAVLRTHSLLGRMMQEGPADDRAFSEGVDRSGDEGGLLHHLFGVRTRALFGELNGAQAPSYLSGLLIGTELRSMAGAKEVFLVGTAQLAAGYSRAAGLLGIKTTILDPLAAPKGLYRLAQAVHA
ncbi:MAG TPA: 2-dehydro-3-deoxygalactonokinase [Burkholderiales bacterium]|nr:2-dehydro-3-deoxygalactonokinase [Burkholderiales bacterium]